MPKYKSCNYDQPILVPVNLPDQLEFPIHYIVDNEISLFNFEEHFKNDEEGRPGHIEL